MPTVFQSKILLRAHGLKKHFGGQVVLDGVNLDLHQGEVVLLRGENGSGKTTLLNILTGNLEPDSGEIHYLADSTPRIYQFPRRWWQELNPFDHFTPEFVAREGVCRTWQEVRLFDTQTLRDNIAVAEPGHPGENPILGLFLPRHSARREEQINLDAEAILGKLGLKGRENSSADKISLGQSKRVAIARSVAAGARILFLDEPLAGLDKQGISGVLSFLETLTCQHGITLVIIEHVFNQPQLSGLVTTDWLLEKGIIKRKVNEANGEAMMQSIEVNEKSQSSTRPDWFEIFADSGTELHDEPLPHGALLTRVRHSEIFKSPPQPILEVRNLIVMRGTRTVIGEDERGSTVGFNLTVYEGEIAILQAPNGWGKSTLFDAICGIISSESGSIILKSRRLEMLATHERFRAGLRGVPSDHRIFPTLSVKDVMKLGRRKYVPDELNKFANRLCSSLSGGEQKRVALTVHTDGTLTLYDEPISALDKANVARFPRIGLPDTSSAQLILMPGQH